MKALKVLGIAAVVVWMAWATFQLNRMYELETKICGIAFGKQANGSLRMPLACPETGRGIE